MNERSFYAARPINTYGTAIGRAYLEFLHQQFRMLDICDPGSDEVKAKVEAIRARYPDQESYNKDGAREVMQMFTDLVQSMDGGAGLALPMNDERGFAVPAGIAKELATIHKNGNPTWIVTCTKTEGSEEVFVFALHQVMSMTEAEVDSTERGGKETRRTFVTYSFPFPRSFPQLSIQETRERIYEWPSRDKLRPYFLCPVETAPT